MWEFIKYWIELNSVYITYEYTMLILSQFCGFQEIRNIYSHNLSIDAYVFDVGFPMADLHQYFRSSMWNPIKPLKPNHQFRYLARAFQMPQMHFPIELKMKSSSFASQLIFTLSFPLLPFSIISFWRQLCFTSSEREYEVCVWNIKLHFQGVIYGSCCHRCHRQRQITFHRHAHYVSESYIVTRSDPAHFLVWRLFENICVG